jgi:putative transposase
LKIPNDNLIKKSELKLSFLQRRLSKKKKGSKNRNKARLKVAKCQDKIKNKRQYRNHNLTMSLVNIYDFIGVETLAVKNMIKNRSLSKAIANVSWSDIVSKIEYKMTENQGHLIKIDQFYPSSKTCSNCGSVKQDMPLEIRIYECSECSYTEDRDINAAKNILAEAKRIAGL